tara:strand:+ start:9715 stop:10149 length:435 start_codon:yes stop_codon:yes gene_type:complete
MTIKDVASNPGPIWVTLLAAVGAILTGYSENKTATESIGVFCQQAEDSSYQALVDLRDKVNWIHMRVKTNEERLAFVSSPPGGPAQEEPPAPSESDESGEKPEEVPPNEKKEPADKSVPLKDDGTIDWAPIKRPAEQTTSPVKK